MSWLLLSPVFLGENSTDDALDCAEHFRCVTSVMRRSEKEDCVSGDKYRMNGDVLHASKSC